MNDLNFSWGCPEQFIAADLVEKFCLWVAEDAIIQFWPVRFYILR